MLPRHWLKNYFVHKHMTLLLKKTRELRKLVVVLNLYILLMFLQFYP